MNRRPKIEYSRLWGELGWQGINTGIISSQRVIDEEAPPSSYGFETLAIHAGTHQRPHRSAFLPNLSTTYVFEDADHAASLFNLQTPVHLLRLTNPTVAALEERLATLEGGRGATCTASAIHLKS